MKTTNINIHLFCHNSNFTSSQFFSRNLGASTAVLLCLFEKPTTKLAFFSSTVARSSVYLYILK
jgi:hypothetical protein